MPDDKTTLELPITGMTCASCVARNERALRKLDGVDEANVNFATEKATVVFDPSLLSARDLVATVEKAGYGVVTRTETLPILGMTCASCVSRVERALAKAPGVVDAAGQPGDREGDRHLRAGAGRPRRPRRRRARPRATTSSRRRRPRGGRRPPATDGASPSPRSTSKQAARAAAYRTLRRKVIVGFVLSADHLRRDHAAALVPVPARLAAQRLRAVGAGDAGAVLGRAGSSTRARLGGACATASART